MLRNDDRNRDFMNRVNADATSASKRGASSKVAPSSSAGAPVAAVASARKHIDSLRETLEENAGAAGADMGNVLSEQGAAALTLPIALKLSLAEDWELVTQKRLLPRLPVSGTPSAADVVDSYVRSLRPEAAAAVGAAAAADGAPPSSAPAPGTKRSRAGENVGSKRGGGAGGAKGEKCSAEEARAIGETLAALLSYLNKALPVLCLYRVERVVFDAWHRERISGTGSGVDAAADAIADEAEELQPLATLVPPLFLLRVLVRLPELLARADVGEAEADVLANHIGGFVRFLAANREEFFSPAAYAKSSSAYNVIAESAMRGAFAPKIGRNECYSSV